MSDLIPPILPGNLTAAQIDLMVGNRMQHRDVRWMNGDLTDEQYAEAGLEPGAQAASPLPPADGCR